MLDKLSQYYFNKGLENAKAGMISIAVENLGRSINYDRSNSKAWKLIGLCFYRLGRLAAAEYCWIKCLQYGGTDSSVEEFIREIRYIAVVMKPHLVSSLHFSSQKKYRKALKVFRKKIIPVLDSQADAFNYMGILYMLSGHKQKAFREWKKALQIDSSNIKAARYLAYS